MHINVGILRYLFRLGWRYLVIVCKDCKEGRNPFRIYIKSYQIYRKHGIDGMLKRVNREYDYRSIDREAVDYSHWCHRNEIINKKCSNDGPRMSIFMTIKEADPLFLKDSISSVQNQTYTNWQLWIVLGEPDSTKLNASLIHIVEEDERLGLIYSQQYKSVTENINDLIHKCRGEWVIFLGENDLFREDALCEVVQVVNLNKDVGLIYSDEDKIDEDEHRSEPNFKPDWNPDLLRSQNYIAYLCAMRVDLIKMIGGLRENFEGSQDYDLYLRITALLKDYQIEHIAKVLYHKRKQIDEFFSSVNVNKVAWDSGLKALQSFLDIVSPKAKAIYGITPYTYNVVYSLVEKPMVSLIIPTRDGYDMLHRCISSILANTLYDNFEILIVDNQSQDHRTLSYLNKISSLQNVRILKYDLPFNFSAINNMAVNEARGEIIGLLNDDVEIITENWLEIMVRHALRPEIGAVGAKLFYDNDTIQHAGVVLGIGGIAGHAHKMFLKSSHGYFSRLQLTQNYSAVTGACLVVHKSLYKLVGGLEEKQLPVAFNDVDFCLKLEKAGYRNVWTPYVEAYHHESISRGVENTAEKISRFDAESAYMRRKWGERIDYDPYYNKNLTKKREDFSLGDMT